MGVRGAPRKQTCMLGSSSCESGCHFTRERGTLFPDWLHISQTFFEENKEFLMIFGKIWNFKVVFD